MSVGEDIGKSIDRIISTLRDDPGAHDHDITSEIESLKQQVVKADERIDDLSARIDSLEWNQEVAQSPEKRSFFQGLKKPRFSRAELQAAGLLLLSCAFACIAAGGIAWLFRTLV